MAIEIVPVDKKEYRAPKSATAAVVKKLEALGAVKFPQSAIQPLADGGWVGVVGSPEERPALLLRKDKAARFVEGCPAGAYQKPRVSDDGATVLLTAVSGEGKEDCALYLLDVVSGEARVVFRGANLSFQFGVPGHLFARDGASVVLMRTDNEREVVRKELPKATDYSFLHVGAACGGRVLLAHCVQPYEIVAFGFYPGEADALRAIGTVPHRWGGAFVEQDGRPLVVTGGKNLTVHELRNLAEAWEAGRAGEVKKKELAPGELGFCAVRYGTYEAGAPVANLRELAHQRDPIAPRAGGGWVTALRLSRKHVKVAVIDPTMAVRTVDLPPAEYPKLRVSEDGTRALMGGVLVTLADLEVKSLDTTEEVDFAAEGRFVIGGTRLCERGPDGALVERARIELAVTEFATAADGRVIAAECRRQDGSPALAIIGVYEGPELRLIATPERPPGVSLYFSRLGSHVMAHAADYLELLGATETWERAKTQPGLPLGALERKPSPQRDAAKPGPTKARPTPRLDALIATIKRNPRRAAAPEHVTRILAGALPDDVRRVLEALAEHEGGAEVVGFAVHAPTVTDRAPGPTGERDDLIVLAEDGGGNLYAIDRQNSGAGSRMLFLDHEEEFADHSLGQTLEELLEEKAQSDDHDDDDDGGDGAGPVKAAASAGSARRLTCTERGSSKFWEGAVEGNTLTVRFGKIGTAGQLKTKSFVSSDVAEKELAKLIKEKLGHGYED